MNPKEPQIIEANPKKVLMNRRNLLKSKIAASLACLAALFVAGSASAQVTVTTSNQYGSVATWPFTPTGSSWVVDQTDSLIYGLLPTSDPGNWTLEIPGRNVNSLTVNTNLTLNQVAGTSGNTTSTNYVSYGNGSGAGSLLVYTLPANANGYNLTNITVYGGWANNGRDQQGYVILYSTVSNPTQFNYLAYVNDNPSVPGNTPSAVQAVVSTPTGGVIAANVAAVEFILNWPGVENGYCGIAAITVGGTAASSIVSPVVSVTGANESGTSPFTPTWTAETPDLIAGLAPSFDAGNFDADGGEGGLSVLTDGQIGISGTPSTMVSCGGNNAGSSLVYTLTNMVNGTDVTNVIVYSGWGDTGRDAQYYILSYSTIAAPATYIPIGTVFYWPGILVGQNGGGSAQANRVAISMTDGSALAHGVANLKFDFSSPPDSGGFNNGWQGYSEIIVQGNPTATPPPPPSALLVQDILPAAAVTVVGDWISFSATYSNTPPVAPQWQQVVGGVTNDINTGVVNVTGNGVVTSTLTISNLQAGNAGTYQLEGLNATNGAAAPSFSSGSSLVVNSLPAPVNNIIVADAGQFGLGAISPVNGSTNFYPTWVEDTDGDLIWNSVDGGPQVPGTVYAGSGNFAVGGSDCNGDPAILSDGSFGYQNYYPGVGGNLTMDTMGITPAGSSVTYTLPSSVNGWSLTNITVYGGWGDAGRDEQKYQVLYSTISAPTVFNNLISVDYLPSNPNGKVSATRTTLTPASGAMAQNVYAVEFNFNNQGSPPENGWEGYSEIVVAGEISQPVPVLLTNPPATAEDVEGSSLILSASFSGATSYQWLKNGTNLPTATSSTLTLNNLQLTDAATNGGYELVAFNSSGSNVSSSCSVFVDPAPAPVGNVVTAFAYQTSAANGWGPTWDTSALSSSLIYQQNPPNGGYDPTGNFNDPDTDPNSFDLAGGLPILTDGNYGVFNNTGAHPAFATCGDTAGEYVIYTLGPNANGYNITNIQISGGWNDNGRDSQFYTVLYSTPANPSMFFPLNAVASDLSSDNTNGGGNGEAVGSAGDFTAVRATMTPVSGVLASNVSAIFVDYQYPSGVPNGYSGYSEVSVFGSPSANPQPYGPVITTEHEETNQTFTLETDNLIGNQLPSSYGPGVFTGEGCNETNMTDGVLGFGYQYSSACGTDTNNSVAWIIFSSTNSTGWNLTNIVVYTLWHDYGRDGQYYNLSYSTESAPNTFLPLTSVAYNPFVPHDGRASGNRVQIAPPVGQSLLASNVAAVKFDFSLQGTEDYDWSGYTQIVLQGTNLPVVVVTPPTPPTISRPTISGGNLILTGSGGTPGAGYTLLTTTNVGTPLSNWTAVTTGTLDGTGSFSNGVPITTPPPAKFFRLRMP